MEGPEGAQARLEDYISAAVPAQLDLIAARYNLARPKDLPNPPIRPAGQIAQVPIDGFPFYTVSILDTLSIDRVDADVAAYAHPADAEEALATPTGPQYRVTYLTRIFAFARGRNYVETSARRHRYVLALRMALLARPSMGSGDAGIDEASWRESYSDVDVAAARTIAAAYVECRVTFYEELTHTEPNYVDLLEVITETMPTGTVEAP